MDHGARKHAPHSASVMHRRIACPGSYRREQMATPRPSSPYAAEGTLAHEMLEHRLRFGEWPASIVPEMRDYLQMVVDYVEGILENEHAQKMLEARFEIISDADPGNVFGMSDIIIYVPGSRTLYVIDLKYGMDPVEVRDNPQLLFYGLGAYLVYEARVENVVLVIAQPRAYHADGPIREWHTDAARLLDFHMQLEDVITACLDPAAPLVPGAKQCKYCAAGISDTGVCPAKEAQALAVAGAQFAGFQDVYRKVLEPPKAMPIDRLAYVLNAADDLISWLEDVQKYAKEKALEGHMIPGRKLVTPDARREFDDAPEMVAFQLFEHFGIDYDAVMPRKLVGVTEVDRLVREAARATATTKAEQRKAVASANEIVATMTTKKHAEGVYSLVREDDRRPAVNPANVFAQITSVPEVKP